MNMTAIIDYAKKQGYETAEFLRDWRGYKVFSAIYNSKENCCVGLPYIILVKGEEIRLSTPDECFDFLNETEDKD